ncbi:type I polyketide synthase [Dietzia cercidiphylli]|uniref:type I polyketide synthase n=1 Tax=Dietzia cercidiphylli TaxID=498199 RepID=UPI003F7FBBD3
MELAIVGMACRLPGGINTPESFWSVLNNKETNSTGIDPQRWSDYTTLGGPAGATAVNTNDRGYYLEDIYGFDSSFFNISKTEAKVMDPQQRIMLEVAWEALERAGIAPSSLAGSNTGVYMGAGSDDYGRMMLEDLPGITPWTGIGAALCGIPNRISYSLDLHGPSVAFDTACSSSLAALTYAVADIRSGRIGTAIVGGINIIAAPGLSRVLQVAGATSTDGTCKSFTDLADGYGRGEGAVALILKSLDSAVKDNDEIVAVVKESCLGQDGRTNGIMAPNGLAQGKLFEQTCRAVGVDPSEVVYVEAHGTGTPAGDFEELTSLSSVYGRALGRSQECVVGSAKAEVGHLEAAAGLVGVLKAALVLSKGVIPPQRLVSGLNSKFQWEGSGVTVPTKPIEIASLASGGIERPTVAVSSYGYGGTLGHVLMHAPDRAEAGKPEISAVLGRKTEIPLRISGVSEESLRRNAGKLSEFLQEGALQGLDLAQYNSTRELHKIYAVTNSRDRGGLVAELEALSQADEGSAFSSRKMPGETRIAFVFSGQGSQWSGMLKHLTRDSENARHVFQLLDPIYKEELGQSLVALVDSEETLPTWLDQAALFAVQAAIASDLRTLGVKPALVFGHSVGEVAAAVAAGTVSLQDGARIICRRSRAISSLEGTGSMWMLRLPLKDAQSLINEVGIGEIAVQLTSTACVVSLSKRDTDAFEQAARDRGVNIRRVDSAIPFHSSLVEPATREFEQALHGIAHSAPNLPFLSTSGESTTNDYPADAGYWTRNLRNRVDLQSAVAAARRQGIDFFIEVGGRPVLEAAIEATAGSEQVGAHVEHVMSPIETYEEALRDVYRKVLLSGVQLERSRAVSSGAFPTYQWDDRQLRYAPSSAERDGNLSDLHHAISLEPAHRGERLIRVAANSSLDLYPGSHQVFGEEVVPAAYYLGQVLQSACPPVGNQAVALSHIQFIQRTVPGTGTEVTWWTSSNRAVCWQKTADQIWGEVEPCFTADIAHTERAPDKVVKSHAPYDKAPDGENADAIIGKLLANSGVRGRAYTWTVVALRSDTRIRGAQVQVPLSTWTESLLDAVLTIAAANVAAEGNTGALILSSIEHLVLTQRRATTVELAITQSRHYRDVYDFVATTTDGEVLAYCDGIHFESTDRRGSLGKMDAHCIEQFCWEPAEASMVPERGSVLAVTDGAQRLQGESSGIRLRYSESAKLIDAESVGEVDTIIVLVEDAMAQDEKSSDWVSGRIETEKALLRLLGTVANLPLRRYPRMLLAVSHSNGDQTGDALARVSNRELPDLPVAVVHCPGEFPTIEQLLSCPDNEPVARLVKGDVWEVPRLKPINGERSTPLDIAGGTFIVAGASGGIGQVVTEFLADSGAGRVFALSRSAQPSTESTALIASPVETVQVDLSDPESIHRFTERLRLEGAQVDGLFHCAGQVVSRPTWQCTDLDIDDCCSPKVTSLTDLLNNVPYSSDAAMMLFSSCGYQLGIPGQAAYGIANAILDDWSTLTSRNGSMDVRSIAWTSWRGTGVAKGADTTRRILELDGVAEIEPTVAIEALREIMCLEPGNYTVLGVESTGSSNLPANQANHPPSSSKPKRDTPKVYSDRAAMSLGVRTIVAELVDEEVESISEENSLDHIGMDSLMTMRLRGALADEFAVTIKASELIDAESIGEIVSTVARLRETADGAPEEGLQG